MRCREENFASRGSGFAKNMVWPGRTEATGPLTRYSPAPERVGFERARMTKLLKALYLQQKTCNFKELDSLESILFSHGFLLFRDEI